MKRTIFVIFINLIMVSVMVLSVSAQNGQNSFYDGNAFSNNVNDNPYGILFDTTYVSNQTGLNFQLNLGRGTSDWCRLFIVPVDAKTPTSNQSAYVNYIVQKDLLDDSNQYFSGAHSIPLRNLSLSVGTYKLVAIYQYTDTSLLSLKIYEYYFLYCGERVNYDPGEAALDIDFKATVSEYEGSTFLGYKLLDHSYTDIFTYTGTIDPYSTSTPTYIQVRLDLGYQQFWQYFIEEHQYNKPADFFCLNIGKIGFTAHNGNDSFHVPLCRVFLRDNTNGIQYVLGDTYNIGLVSQASNRYPYSFYIPKSAIPSQDTTFSLYLMFVCYFADNPYMSQSSVETFDYTVTVADFSYNAFYLNSSSASNEAINALNNAGDILASVDKPDISAEDLDIGTIVSPDDIAMATLAIRKLDTYFIFGSICAIVAILMLVAYLFFGKRS